MILQELAETIEKSGHKASPDNYNEDLNSFSLDVSHPAKTVTQQKSGFLTTQPKAYASKSDEIQSRIQDNGQLIVKNSSIKPNEQLQNKQKRDADDDHRDKEPERNNASGDKNLGEQDTSAVGDDDNQECGEADMELGNGGNQEGHEGGT